MIPTKIILLALHSILTVYGKMAPFFLCTCALCGYISFNGNVVDDAAVTAIMYSLCIMTYNCLSMNYPAEMEEGILWILIQDYYFQSLPATAD